LQLDERRLRLLESGFGLIDFFDARAFEQQIQPRCGLLVRAHRGVAPRAGLVELRLAHQLARHEVLHALVLVAFGF
jgi:hypothetical protein